MQPACKPQPSLMTAFRLPAGPPTATSWRRGRPQLRPALLLVFAVNELVDVNDALTRVREDAACEFPVPLRRGLRPMGPRRRPLNRWSGRRRSSHSSRVVPRATVAAHPGLLLYSVIGELGSRFLKDG